MGVGGRMIMGVGLRSVSGIGSGQRSCLQLRLQNRQHSKPANTRSTADAMPSLNPNP